VKHLKYVSAVLIITIISMSCAMAAQHADARTVAKSQHTFYAPAAVITGVPLNFYNAKGMPRWGPLMTMGYLGVLKFSSNPFSFIPGIASKWKVSKNGKQVTAFLPGDGALNFVVEQLC